MDQKRLDAIRARCDAATPGPWKKNSKKTKEYPFSIIGDPDYQPDGTEWTIIVTGAKESNAEFISHARNDIPFLLRKVKELQAENTALRRERDVALDASYGLCILCIHHGESMCDESSPCFEMGFKCRKEYFPECEHWELRGIREETT